MASDQPILLLICAVRSDFGDSNIVRENFSAHMSIKGTPCYMAPVRNDRAIDIRPQVCC